jgi:hypothetical protein
MPLVTGSAVPRLDRLPERRLGLVEAIGHAAVRAVPASEQRDRLVRVAALGFLEIEENWKVFTLPRRRA